MSEAIIKKINDRFGGLTKTLKSEASGNNDVNLPKNITIEEKFNIPKFLTKDDFLKNFSIERKYLIEGFLYQNSFNILAADTGTGKSFLALYTAFCVQNGLEFLGNKTIKGNCLYICNEDDPVIFLERIKKLNFLDMEFPEFSFYSNDKIDFSQKKDMKNLSKIIEEKQITFLVIDSLQSSTPDKTDQLSEKEMNLIMRNLNL
jgi:RecA-family ATPase